MSECKHLEVLSSILVRADNGPITPLSLIIFPFEIDGIKLQVRTLMCDSKIPLVVLCF